MDAIECETCGGLGRLRVTEEDGERRDSDRWRKCLDCNGSGKEPPTIADHPDFDEAAYWQEPA